MREVYAKCGMRCDLCLIYRPNVEREDRRAEICAVWKKQNPAFTGDPSTIICDGCASEGEGAVLFDRNCKARNCVREKGYAHCGYCESYPCGIYPAEPSPEEIARMIDVEKLWTWEDEKLMEAYARKKYMDAFRKERGLPMHIYRLTEQSAGQVAALMHRIKPDWWPTFADAYGQLTDIGETIRTVGWYLGADRENPKGWILCRELLGYRALELECSGFDDNGVFKLEHKLGELFRVAEAYAREKGYLTFRSGISSVGFPIHGRPVEDIAGAIASLDSSRVDYQWYLAQGFRVIGIQPNAYAEGFHLIILGKDLTGKKN